MNDLSLLPSLPTKQPYQKPIPRLGCSLGTNNIAEFEGRTITLFFEIERETHAHGSNQVLFLNREYLLECDEDYRVITHTSDLTDEQLDSQWKAFCGSSEAPAVKQPDPYLNCFAPR